MEYLRRAGSIPAAMKLAREEHHAFNTSVWVGALGDLLAGRDGTVREKGRRRGMPHPVDRFEYASVAVGAKLPWHLRERKGQAHVDGTAVALCGVRVGKGRPEPVRREFIDRTCRTCAQAFARAFGGPVVERPKKKRDTRLEDLFAQQVESAGLPLAVREFRFAVDQAKAEQALTTRAIAAAPQWRFDFAWTTTRVAVEIEGGLYLGKHSQHAGAGAEDGFVKANIARLMGWAVLHASARQVKSGVALKWVRAMIRIRSGPLMWMSWEDIVAEEMIPERTRGRKAIRSARTR